MTHFIALFHINPLNLNYSEVKDDCNTQDLFKS